MYCTGNYFTKFPISRKNETCKLPKTIYLKQVFRNMLPNFRGAKALSRTRARVCVLTCGITHAQTVTSTGTT